MYMQQDQGIICRRIKRFNMERGVVNHEFQVIMGAPGSRDTRRKLVLSVRNSSDNGSTRIQRHKKEAGALGHKFQVIVRAPGSRDKRRKLVLSVRNFK
jgi:hypothetical protein